MNKRDTKAIAALIGLSFVSLYYGGKTAFLNYWSMLVDAFGSFFVDLAKLAVENYFSSPYFIVRIIMLIGSVFGIWFGHKGGKTLWIIVSLVVVVLNLASMGVEIL